MLFEYRSSQGKETGRLSALPGVLYTGVLISSIAGIIGWHLGIKVLISLHPSFPPMQYNTAAAFGLCALAGLLSHSNAHIKKVAIFLFSVVGIFSFTTLLQYILSTSWGIDELFVLDRFATETPYPGRMSPQTCISFILLSAAYLHWLLLERPNSLASVRVILLAPILVIVAMAITGYIAKIQYSYRWQGSTGVSILTALNFSALLIAAAYVSIFNNRAKTAQVNPYNIINILTIGVAVSGLNLVFFTEFWLQKHHNYLKTQHNEMQHASTLADQSVSQIKTVRQILELHNESPSRSTVSTLSLLVSSSTLAELNTLLETKNVVSELFSEEFELVNLWQSNYSSILQSSRTASPTSDFSLLQAELDVLISLSQRLSMLLTAESSAVQKQLIRTSQQVDGLFYIYIFAVIVAIIFIIRELNTQGLYLALQRQKDFLSQVLDTSLNAVYVYDVTNRRYLTINNSFTRITGYSLEEVNTKENVKSLIHPEDRPTAIDHLKTPSDISLPGESTQEFRIKGSNDNWIWCLSRHIDIPAKWMGDTLKGKDTHLILGCFVDITHLKSNQEQLNRAIAELDLANGDLIQANNDLRDFAYFASHDLQEPLRKVLGFVSLLQADVEQGNKDDIDKDLHYISDATQRMQALIKDLFSLARLHRSEVELVPVAIRNIVTEVIQELDLPNTNIITIDLDDNTKVIGDSRLLHQVFTNLLTNAIKFAQEGIPPAIKISMTSTGDHCTLCVSDNGIGIDKDYLESIFAAFFRIHGRSHYPGSGVGLAICKKAVDIMKGKIWANSEPGAGSQFYIQLEACSPNA